MAISTSPIPAPPHLKSVEEDLKEGFRKQEALRPKEKARKKSEKNDRKRKREDGDVEEDASGFEAATSGKDEKEGNMGGTGADVTPRIFKAGKVGKDNKRKREDGGNDCWMEKGGSVEEAPRRRDSDTAEAASPKSKKRNSTEGNTATEAVDDGKASWLITPNAKNGAIPFDLDTAMKAWKHSEKEKRNSRKARKSTSREARKEGSYFTAMKREAPSINHDKEENQTATSESKTKARAAPKILDMELNQNASQGPSQEPCEHLLASSENVHLEAMADTLNMFESLVTSKPKPKEVPARITALDPKIKSELLIQTILKGRQNASSPKSETSIKPAAFKSNKSSSFSPGSGRQDVAATQIKARNPGKPQTKKQFQVDNSITKIPKPQDSLSEIVELIKISTKSKLQKFFDREPSAPRGKLDFFDDEPLRDKKERMLAKAAWSPAKPTNLARHVPLHPDINTAKSVAADKRHEKAAALAGWESSSGKVRGIVGAHPDEDPEENIAFSSMCISSRQTGVQIRDSAFNTISLTPGKELKFKVDKRYSLTICSVASGWVEVSVGKLDFGITEGGMWRIKGKEYCVVKNKGEKVAVLHVTAMP